MSETGIDTRSSLYFTVDNTAIRVSDFGHNVPALKGSMPLLATNFNEILLSKTARNRNHIGDDTAKHMRRYLQRVRKLVSYLELQNLIGFFLKRFSLLTQSLVIKVTPQLHNYY